MSQHVMFVPTAEAAKMARKACVLEHRVLAAGTIVHIDGVPVELSSDVTAFTHRDNWREIDDLRKFERSLAKKKSGGKRKGC